MHCVRVVLRLQTKRVVLHETGRQGGGGEGGGAAAEDEKNTSGWCADGNGEGLEGGDRGWGERGWST